MRSETDQWKTEKNKKIEESRKCKQRGRMEGRKVERIIEVAKTEGKNGGKRNPMEKIEVN